MTALERRWRPSGTLRHHARAATRALERGGGVPAPPVLLVRYRLRVAETDAPVREVAVLEIWAETRRIRVIEGSRAWDVVGPTGLRASMTTAAGAVVFNGLPRATWEEAVDDLQQLAGLERLPLALGTDDLAIDNDWAPVEIPEAARPIIDELEREARRA